MFKKILLAYDGSEYANKAYEYVLELAQKSGCEIYLLSVAHIPEFIDTKDEIDGALNSAKAYYTKILGNAKKLAKEKGIEVYTNIVPGHPADAIIQFAEKNKCDLIVVGERGNSGVKRYIIGNVAESIVKHAKCSVLVVKK